MAISGNTILVGVDSFFHPDQSGAAYVFASDGGSFVQQAKLLSPDGAPQSRTHAVSTTPFLTGDAYVFDISIP